MLKVRERAERRRRGVGWLGAGRILAGLAVGFALMAIGLAGLRSDVAGLVGSSGTAGAPTRPELIPGVQGPASGLFAGGAVPGSLPGGTTASPADPLSPSARATPLPAPPRVQRSVGGGLEVVAGRQDDVAGPPARAALHDSDGDGVPDAVERRLGTDPHSRDTDGDGMPDGWELRFGLNPRNDIDANADPDHDGVSNLNEYRIGTSPLLADTNGDGVPDGRADPDHDGVPNAVEQRLGLDPSQSSTPPSDRDLKRTARNVAAPAPTADVLSAGEVMVQPATVGDHPTDGALDSDGDGLPNALEVTMGLDPTKVDSDGDGIPDGAEDYDHDGLPNALELRLGLDPSKADSDGDGVPDGQEDADGDGLSNLVELALRLDPSKADTDGNGVPDGLEDTDGDGMTNAAEIAAGRDPATPDPPAATILEPPPPVTVTPPAPVVPAAPAPAPPPDPAPAP